MSCASQVHTYAWSTSKEIIGTNWGQKARKQNITKYALWLTALLLDSDVLEGGEAGDVRSLRVLANACLIQVL